MDYLKRFDTHCHLFNADFVFEEAFEMGLYYLFTSVLGESGDTNEEQTSQGCIDEIRKWLNKVIDYFIAAKGDPIIQYSLIQHAYETRTHNKDKICVVPLMMDIFYMFDGVLNRRHSGDKDRDCYNISKEQASKILLDEMKKYVSEKNDKLSKEQINQYINTIENINLDKEIAGDEFEFTYMSPGYRNQFLSMLAMKNLYPETVFPFLAFDPRRPGIMNLVKKYVGKDKPFAGIKLYTRLGYHPNNSGMRPLYEYCIENDLPIIVHTSNGGFPPGDNWKYAYYSDPKEWIDVLKEFTDLRIDFAHFGDCDDNWTSQIVEFMKIYPNVYADISCFTDEESLKRVNNKLESNRVKERLMFGTDYIMVRIWESLTEYFGMFVKVFGNETLDMLMTNPNKFLNL